MEETRREAVEERRMPAGPTGQYRGRIAPSPSGHLHVGHAQTFFIAKQRAEKYHGELVLRIEDIDIQRCKPHFLPDMVEDLTWFGLQPSEGYGTTASVHDDFVQSKRFDLYKQAWKILYDQGYIYPCTLSRRDVEHALSAPQDTSHTASQAEATPTPTATTTTATATTTSGTTNIPNEPVLPAELRPDFVRATPYRPGDRAHFPEKFQHLQAPTDMRINWRFRVPDYTSPDVDEAHDASIAFDDVSCGTQMFTAMRDYGDFLVWRLDGYPSYELAVVVDDILMGVTEVVRGQDLLISTCRQLLLMRAIFGLDFRQRRCWHAPADVGAPIGGLREKQEAEGEAAAIGEAEEDIDGESPAQKRARNDSLSDHHPAASSSSVPAQTPSTWHYARLSSHPTGSILDGSAYFRIPQYYHAPLMCDEDGRRLAKRNFATSLRKMREEGLSPAEIQAKYFHSAFLSSPTL